MENCRKSFIRNNHVKKISSEPDAVIKRATSDSRAIGSRVLRRLKYFVRSRLQNFNPHRTRGAGVILSDSDSAPVPKFLNPDPGPAIFQIWGSDSCSDSGYNHQSNLNLPMFLLKKWPHRLLLLPKLKSDSGSGSGFPKFLTPGPDPVRRKNAESCRSRLRPSGFGSTSAPNPQEFEKFCPLPPRRTFHPARALHVFGLKTAPVRKILKTHK